MNAFRPAATILIALSIVACAATPTRIASPAAPTAQDAIPVATIDAARVRDAAREFGVRTAFRSCVDAAAGTAAAMQACIDTELQYQQSRIDAALASRGGPSGSNGDPAAAQAQWRAERDRICRPDGAAVAATQRIEAGRCKLEATAARASVLAR